MSRSVIAEGKTTAEATEKGLKELKVSKDKVDVKILESEDKRSFFSILTPRVVKVELTLKEGVEEKKVSKPKEQKENRKTEEIKEYVEKNGEKLDPNSDEVKKVFQKTEEFLKEFLAKLPTEGLTYQIEIKEYYLLVTINGDGLNYLIGYRGETLNAIQVLLTSIASKHTKERIRILVDIENYRAKREKALEDLAEKIARTVVKTRKQVTLEPMTAYERKVIHSKLQNNNKVKTYSTGVEPYRKVVVALR